MSIRRPWPIITVLIAVLAIAACAAKPGASTSSNALGFSEPGLVHMGDGMKALVDRGELAGLTLMVTRHGKTVSFDQFGYQSLETRTPMAPDTIFRIYSMTKPITGVAMMILYEEGKWRLDDPVAKYIPQFAHLKVLMPDGTLAKPAHPPTMRELMSHTAGFTYGIFGDSPVDRLYRKGRLFAPGSNLSDMIEKLARLPLDYQPGTQWKYSMSVDIQGYLVEKLSGQSLDAFLKSRIFDPLKMKDTGFFVPPEKIGRFAQVYVYDADGKLTPMRASPKLELPDYHTSPTLLSGGGGLVSTTEDYMRFCEMLLNEGTLDQARILTPESVRLMRSNHLSKIAGAPQTIGRPGIGFGLDFAVVEDVAAVGGNFGRGSYFWAGAAGTWFWIDPANDVAVVGMIQQMTTSLGGPALVKTPPEMQAISRPLIYQALTDPAR